MPRAPASEPLFRTDVNFYLADIDFLKRRVGNQHVGAFIRELVRAKVSEMSRKRTVEDLSDDE